MSGGPSMRVRRICTAIAYGVRCFTIAARVLVLLLGLQAAAQAAPLSTGTIYVTGCLPDVLQGTILLDDATFDVIGTPVNLGAPEPLYDELFINGGTFAFGSPNTFTLPLYNSVASDPDETLSVLGMTVTGVFISALDPAYTYSFVGDASSLTGSRANTLPPGIHVTMDGSVLLQFAFGACQSFAGPVALNAFQPTATTAGTNVAVSAPTTFVNSASGTETSLDVDLVFDTVSGAGETTVTALSNAAGSVPANVSLTSGGYDAFFFD